jgi:peptide subunit release factor 1 (eRF1)
METSFELVQRLSLAKSESRGTSLVTLYVPSFYNMDLVVEGLNQELSTSLNIKSKQVRSDVQSALKSGLYKIKDQIKLSGHKAPENGFVLCSGHSDYEINDVEVMSCV